ncbi:hypothetical protein EauS123_00028 [Exiguobacterium phage vB_EauS-123]|nr:hypothetical protein EauS123_00028 [Exiguobacterium phage vB_EauS-123]
MTDILLIFVIAFLAVFLKWMIEKDIEHRERERNE